MRALVVAASPAQRRFLGWLLRAVPDLAVTAEARLDLAQERLLIEPFALIAVGLWQPPDGAPCPTLAATLAMLAEVRATPGPNASGAWLGISRAPLDAATAERIGFARLLTGAVPAATVLAAAHAALGADPPRHTPRAASGGERSLGSAPWPAPPQRRWPRLNAPAWAHIAAAPAAGGDAAAVPAGPHALADLGPAGAFVASSAAPPPGARGPLELALPHLPGPLLLPFEVVHRRAAAAGSAAGFGVCFGPRPPEALLAALHAPP